MYLFHVDADQFHGKSLLSSPYQAAYTIDRYIVARAQRSVTPDPEYTILSQKYQFRLRPSFLFCVGETDE